VLAWLLPRSASGQAALPALITPRWRSPDVVRADANTTSVQWCNIGCNIRLRRRDAFALHSLEGVPAWIRGNPSLAIAHDTLHLVTRMAVQMHIFVMRQVTSEHVSAHCCGNFAMLGDRFRVQHSESIGKRTPFIEQGV
jgi:hypothetical protein